MTVQTQGATGLFRRSRLLTVAVALTAAVVGLAACSSSKSSSGGSSSAGASSGGSASNLPAIPSGNINVGLLAPMSGALAPIGLNLAAEYKAVVQLVNTAGGIAGHQLTLTSMNDQGDPAVAVTAARQLVNDKVAAVFYAGLSETLDQSAAVFDAAHVPMIQSESQDKYTDPTNFPYFFPTSPSDQATLAILAQIGKTLGKTKVAILQDSSPVAVNWVKDFNASAGTNGITVAGDYTYPLTAVDVSTQVRQAKATGADTVVLLAEAGLNHVYDAMRQIGWSPTILTHAVAYAVGYTSLQALGQNTYTFCYATLPSTTATFSGTALEVMQAITAVSPAQPNSGGDIISYDSVQMLKAAIEANKSLDGAGIKAYLEKFNAKSFTSPDITYTYSPTAHQGISASSVKTCRMSDLGQFMAAVSTTLP